LIFVTPFLYLHLGIAYNNFVSINENPQCQPEDINRLTLGISYDILINKNVSKLFNKMRYL